MGIAIKAKLKKVYQGAPGKAWRSTLIRAYLDGAWSAYIEYWETRNDRGWHELRREDVEWWECARRVNRLARWAMRRDGVLTNARLRALRRLDAAAKGELAMLRAPKPGWLQ
jgi:hypothetical protein